MMEAINKMEIIPIKKNVRPKPRCNNVFSRLQLINLKLRIKDILEFMKHRDSTCVKDITKKFGFSQKATWVDLNFLVGEEIITREKDRSYLVFYKLASPKC